MTDELGRLNDSALQEARQRWLTQLTTLQAQLDGYSDSVDAWGDPLCAVSMRAVARRLRWVLAQDQDQA